MTASSMAEQRAVNSKVPGSSPGRSAEGKGGMRQTKKSSQLYVELTEGIREVGGVPCESVPDAFFVDFGDPNSHQKGKLARKLCAECPLTLLCLEYALEANEHEGTWGGLTGTQRAGLKKNRMTNARVH